MVKQYGGSSGIRSHGTSALEVPGENMVKDLMKNLSNVTSQLGGG